MVPEWFRNPILAGFTEWFRNGSGMVPEEFHVSPEDIFDEDPIPSALSAKITVTLFVVLSRYFGGPFKCLEEYVGFLRNILVGFRKIYIYVPGKVAGQNQYL